MKYLLPAVAALAVAFPPAAFAQAKPELEVRVEGIDSDGYINPDHAFCIPAATGHVKEGPDKSLGVFWSKAPSGTKSFAIIMVDPDVPAVFDDAGKEGKTLAEGMPRKSFYHWVLYDIPADKTQIPGNTDSNGVVKQGKTVLTTSYGTRGVNDYAAYFASDPERRGVYAGYDGPCPPWNDERVHHYHLKVFALDVEKLEVQEPLAGPQAMDAIAKHILAQGEVVGKYTLNPGVKK